MQVYTKIYLIFLRVFLHYVKKYVIYGCTNRDLIIRLIGEGKRSFLDQSAL